VEADITAYMGGYLTSAEDTAALTSARLFVRRHRVPAAATALIAVLTLVYMIKVVSSEKKATAHAIRADANALEAKLEAARAREAETLAKREQESTRRALARSAKSLALAAMREENGAAMRAALDGVPEDLRDSEWRYLLSQADSSIARINLGTKNTTGVVPHPRLPGVFAMAGKSGRVVLMNVRTGSRLLEFNAAPPKGRGKEHVMAISADGERIAIGNMKGGAGIAIHSARDGQRIIAWEGNLVRRLKFSRDGHLLLGSNYRTSDSDSFLTAWDSATGKIRWSREYGTRNQGNLLPDSRMMLITTDSEGLQLLDTHDGSVVRQVSPLLRSNAAVHPEGTMIVSMLLESDAGLAESLPDGKELFTIPAQNMKFSENRGFRIAFVPDGESFVMVGRWPDGRSRIHHRNARTGALLQPLMGGEGGIRGICVHPLSGELFVYGRNPAVWDLIGLPKTWSGYYGDGKLSNVAFWGDDDMVFAPHEGFPIALQRLGPVGSETLWTPPSTNHFDISVSQDGRCAAICNIDSPASIMFLQKRGSSIEQVGAITHSKTVFKLSMSPNGERLAMLTGGGRPELYDRKTGAPSVKLDETNGKRVLNLGWVRNDRLLGLVSDQGTLQDNSGATDRVVIWDADSGEILQETNFTGMMDALAISPDGNRIAVAGNETWVRILDSATLTVQREIRAHNGPIKALAWHPTRPIVASGSADLNIRVWDLHTETRFAEVRGLLAEPSTLTFSPSGSLIACASKDGQARLWEFHPRHTPADALHDRGGPTIEEQRWFSKARPEAAPLPPRN